MNEEQGVRPEEMPDPLLTQPEVVTAEAVEAGEGDGGRGGGGGARKPATAFIFFTVMLDMVALGMIAPVLPRLIEGFLGGDAAGAARMLGLFGTTFAGMQFVCSPVLGSLSDRFGRRPVVLVSNFGLAADYLLMAWAPALPWLLVGRVISGITASSIPTAMAYMADVTPHEKRAAAFGMLSAAFGVGFVVGPAVGGVLGSVNPRLPFLVAAGLSLLNGVYGTFVLPESLKKENRSAFSWKRANPVGSMVMLSRSGTIKRLSVVLLLGYVAQQSLQNVYVLYADYRYHWGPRPVGLSLGFVGVLTILYGAFVVRKSVAKFGEPVCMFAGLACGAVGYAGVGGATAGWMVLLAMPVMNLMSLTWPAAQSLMSREAGAHEQGQMQGAINGIRGASGIVGPSLFAFVFARAVGPQVGWHVPGAPFFVAALMLAVAIPVALGATKGLRKMAA